MRKYLRDGNLLFPTSNEVINISDKLPVNNFIIQYIPMKGPAFVEVSGFELPKKLYGTTEKQAIRIRNTFVDRNKSTGVLLHGEKGSGKSVTAKQLSNEVAKIGKPTILVNEAPEDAQAFSALISSITQPCMILFDEFDKHFSEGAQNNILSLLDGVFQTNMLFVFTCNSEHRISEYMKNRPSRIYYSIAFTGLTDEEIIEYCNENLMDKEHIATLCKFSKMFDNFNFDMLQAVVEEMNRYKETPIKAIEYLNVKSFLGGNEISYSVELFKDGERIPVIRYDNNLYINPTTCPTFDVDLYEVDDDKEDPWNLPEAIKLTSDELIPEKTNLQKGVFTYEKDNYTVILTKPKRKILNYKSWLI